MSGARHCGILYTVSVVHAKEVSHTEEESEEYVEETQRYHVFMDVCNTERDPFDELCMRCRAWKAMKGVKVTKLMGTLFHETDDTSVDGKSYSPTFRDNAGFNIDDGLIDVVVRRIKSTRSSSRPRGSPPSFAKAYDFAEDYIQSRAKFEYGKDCQAWTATALNFVIDPEEALERLQTKTNLTVAAVLPKIYGPSMRSIRNITNALEPPPKAIPKKKVKPFSPSMELPSVKNAFGDDQTDSPQVMGVPASRSSSPIRGGLITPVHSKAQAPNGRKAMTYKDLPGYVRGSDDSDLEENSLEEMADQLQRAVVGMKHV
jgi:hypothetical protein